MAGATDPIPPDPQAQPHQPLGLPGWVRRGLAGTSQRSYNPNYSRRVAYLKIGLPFLALVMISLIAVWPRLTGITKGMGKIDKTQTVMLNPRYFSHDRQDRPFSMTAKSATESPQQRNLVDLVKPEAEMTQSNGSWVTITAERGRYNQENGRLLLLDNVHFLRDDGFEFTTEEAEIDTKSGNAWGNHKVAGQGPNGEIRAEGFNAIDHGKTVTFTRASNATITKSPAAKGSAVGKGTSP